MYIKPPAILLEVPSTLSHIPKFLIAEQGSTLPISNLLGYHIPFPIQVTAFTPFFDSTRIDGRNIKPFSYLHICAGVEGCDWSID